MQLWTSPIKLAFLTFKPGQTVSDYQPIFLNFGYVFGFFKVKLFLDVYVVGPVFSRTSGEIVKQS